MKASMQGFLKVTFCVQIDLLSNLPCSSIPLFGKQGDGQQWQQPKQQQESVNIRYSLIFSLLTCAFPFAPRLSFTYFLPLSYTANVLTVKFTYLTYLAIEVATRICQYSIFLYNLSNDLCFSLCSLALLCLFPDSFIHCKYVNFKIHIFYLLGNRSCSKSLSIFDIHLSSLF